MNLKQLKETFVHAGAKRLYAKPLAENDNSKNQVYFGPDFEALNLFPCAELVAENSQRSQIFKGKLKFSWLGIDGALTEAPGAQLILYPQYPEVRFSGFLRGCANPPSPLMANRISGRILFLAVTGDRRIIGFVVGPSHVIAAEFSCAAISPSVGVFFELSLPTVPTESSSRAKLLAELGRINRLGWIDSKQLDSTGVVRPCCAPQCGGFTLEAELGIPKNSIAEPDFHGWEVKQHSVTNFTRLDSGTAITLMTPEPTGGFYKQFGVEAFIRKFGYPDKNDKPDRMNFGGVYRANCRQPSTGLTMQLNGYDPSTGKITEAGGSVALVSDEGIVAADWAFSSLLAHWSRKHTRAAYVPSMRRTEPCWQYSYGSRIRLAQRTDGLRLIRALACGAVFYDPGIKLENASSLKPMSKRRSQFRVASKDIDSLYETIEIEEV